MGSTTCGQPSVCILWRLGGYVPYLSMTPQYDIPMVQHFLKVKETTFKRWHGHSLTSDIETDIKLKKQN